MSILKIQNFNPKFKVIANRRRVTFVMVFLAGLGLGALVIGQGFIASMRRVGSIAPQSIAREEYERIDGIPQEEEFEGFKDPLITLVKPTAAYRPETPLQPEGRVSDPVWGTRDAPVRIVLFGDMADPATREALQIVQNVWERSQNAVQLVWKDFPLPTNQGAREMALAGRCAQAQGRFWEYIMEITNYKLQITNFIEIAKGLGLEEGTFERCLSSREPVELVNRGMEEAQALEVDAVPTVFVGRYRLSGVVTVEAVERLVTAIIDQ